MKKSYKIIFRLFIIVLVFLSENAFAQQDAHYTQYMYNTLSINPAYAGSRNRISFVGLHRSQWAGLEGAPRTQTLSIHSPIGAKKRVGLGLNVINDQIFIANETFIDINFSYSLQMSYKAKLAFGIKAGGHLLDINYSEATPLNNGDPLATNQEDINNRLLPQVGTGLFYYNDHFYAGLSVPNLLMTEHFDGTNSANATYLAKERISYYLTSGYVFDISERFKLKPATLLKIVTGAPLQIDVSANALLHDKFILGLGYRWDVSLSALAGFQITNGILIGFAYDMDTTELSGNNNGSYEVLLRFEIFSNPKGLRSPRFF